MLCEFFIYCRTADKLVSILHWNDSLPTYIEIACEHLCIDNDIILRCNTLPISWDNSGILETGNR
jgi:hypothetical protein